MQDKAMYLIFIYKYSFHIKPNKANINKNESHVWWLQISTFTVLEPFDFEMLISEMAQ